MELDTHTRAAQPSWWTGQKKALGILIHPVTRPVTGELVVSPWALAIQIGIWTIMAAGGDLVYHWLYPLKMLAERGGKLVYTTASPQLQNAVQGLSLGLLLLLPLVFFIDMGVIYALARRAEGAGTFRAQCSAMVLLLMPLGVVNSLLQFVPLVSTIATLALFVYGLILQVKVVRRIHEISTGRAIGTVLLPLALFMILGCILTVTLGVLLVQMLR